MRNALLCLAAVVALVGCGGQSQNASTTATTETPAAAPQEIQIAITDVGFEPANITVPKGQPVTLVFTRKAEHTCANEAVFPALAKSYPLPLNQPVRVELAGVQDTLTYACPMNMFGGTIKAE